MSTTVGDILLNVAYRNDMVQIPGDGVEYGQWLANLNEGYFYVLRKRKWWFLIGNYGFTYVSGKTRYRLPADFNGIKTVWINSKEAFPQDAGKVYGNVVNDIQIAGLPVYALDGNNVVTKEVNAMASASVINSVASVLQLTSIDTVATGITSTPHGLKNDDWVKIDGVSESTYNGIFRVWVNSPTSFSYEMEDSTTTQATLSGSSANVNVTPLFLVIEYQKMPTERLSTDTDEILIPDAYTSCLDAYTFHKIAKLDTQRATAADALIEFNETLNDLFSEQTKRQYYGQQVGG